MSENRKLSAMIDLIKDDTGRMREHDGYVGDGNLAYLTEKQAEIAIYLGVPIGVRSQYDDYHGSHKGEYSFDMVSNMRSLKYCLGQKHMESRAAVYPYVPDPERMLGYLKQVEEMNLPAWELKAEGGYGLRQLRSLAGMFEHWTDGKQQFAGDFTGGVYIKQDDSAVTGIQMSRFTDRESGGCRLFFQGCIRRMGVYMTPEELRESAGEVKQTADLLDRLAQEPIIATEEEMKQWAKEVVAMQVDRAITEASSRNPQLDPTMGMM